MRILQGIVPMKIPSKIVVIWNGVKIWKDFGVLISKT